MFYGCLSVPCRLPFCEYECSHSLLGMVLMLRGEALYTAYLGTLQHLVLCPLLHNYTIAIIVRTVSLNQKLLKVQQLHFLLLFSWKDCKQAFIPFQYKQKVAQGGGALHYHSAVLNNFCFQRRSEKK